MNDLILFAKLCRLLSTPEKQCYRRPLLVLPISDNSLLVVPSFFLILSQDDKFQNIWERHTRGLQEFRGTDGVHRI
jgi:hypothetical protein